MRKTIFLIMFMLMFASVSGLAFPDYESEGNATSTFLGDMQTSIVDFFYSNQLGSASIESYFTIKCLILSKIPGGDTMSECINKNVNEDADIDLLLKVVKTKEAQYVDTGSDSTASNLGFNESEKYSHLKQYQYQKNLQLDNISSAWTNIISVFQIVFELIYVSFQVFLFYFFIWIFIEIVPESMLFFRKMVFRVMSRRGK